MKRILVIITGLMILSKATDAQYSIYKAKYDYRTYSFQMGDPYNPSAMGFASIVIPGLGQIIEGESTRGLGFLGGSIAMAGFKWIVIWKTNASYTAKDIIRKSNLVGQIGLRVWSGINAGRIAKVNNLAFRDKYDSVLTMKILPYSDLLDNYGFCKTYPVGLTLILSF